MYLRQIINLKSYIQRKINLNSLNMQEKSQ